MRKVAVFVATLIVGVAVAMTPLPACATGMDTSQTAPALAVCQSGIIMPVAFGMDVSYEPAAVDCQRSFDSAQAYIVERSSSQVIWPTSGAIVGSYVDTVDRMFALSRVMATTHRHNTAEVVIAWKTDLQTARGHSWV